jgi:biotin transport system substrate-specific component
VIENEKELTENVVISETKLKSNRTRQLAYAGVFTAIIAALSQLSVPMPSGVPISLQTFGIAFCGFFLGWKLGLVSVGVYIALGAAGVPVFSNFTGGVGKLIGLTGGFIWGFAPMASLCGIKNKTAWLNIATGLAGLIICHALGVIQFSAVSGMELMPTFMLVSLPYLLKDVISVVLAYLLALTVKKRLRITEI